VRSTIDLAHSLGLTVVAERVESPEICDRLRALGCDAVQGIFIAAPGPAVSIGRWVAGRNAQRPRDNLGAIMWAPIMWGPEHVGPSS